MGVLQAGLLNQPSAQVIDGSLRFDDGKSQYLKRTAGSGNQKTYTFSTWIKRGDGPARIFGDYHNPNYQGIDFSIRGNDDAIEFHNYNGSTSTYVDQKISNDKFRDTGWYHVMFSADTTESASEDKFKIYVNGRRITSWATNTVGTATNGNTFGNTAVEQRLGYNYQYSDQTLTQTYFIDGQALGPENFGFTDPLTNTWRPKKYTGTFTSSAVAGTGTLTNYDSNTQYPTYSNQGGGSSTIANILKAFDGDNSTYADMTYLNSQYSRLTFENPITNVTNITIGYDGEGDPGYNGANHQTSVSFNGSRQSIQLYNGSGKPSGLAGAGGGGAGGPGSSRGGHATASTGGGGGGGGPHAPSNNGQSRILTIKIGHISVGGIITIKCLQNICYC
jgi:hypothetical protein